MHTYIHTWHQAVAQEEDDIASAHALKASLQDMDGRKAVAARAVEEFTQEVTEAERLLEALKTEGVNMEKAFKKVCVYICDIM
jgi:hypothetical protein